jgi:hypothetical protein
LWVRFPHGSPVHSKRELKIDPLIKVIYNSSKEALEAGKRPSQVCKPPAEVYWEEKKPQEN